MPFSEDVFKLADVAISAALVVKDCKCVSRGLYLSLRLYYAAETYLLARTVTSTGNADAEICRRGENKGQVGWLVECRAEERV